MPILGICRIHGASECPPMCRGRLSPYDVLSGAIIETTETGEEFVARRVHPGLAEYFGVEPEPVVIHARLHGVTIIESPDPPVPMRRAPVPAPPKAKRKLIQPPPSLERRDTGDGEPSDIEWVEIPRFVDREIERVAAELDEEAQARRIDIELTARARAPHKKRFPARADPKWVFLQNRRQRIKQRWAKMHGFCRVCTKTKDVIPGTSWCQRCASANCEAQKRRYRSA